MCVLGDLETSLIFSESLLAAVHWDLGPGCFPQGTGGLLEVSGLDDCCGRRNLLGVCNHGLCLLDVAPVAWVDCTSALLHSRHQTALLDGFRGGRVLIRLCSVAVRSIVSIL